MQRGEIYVADLGPGVGREATGTRPVVIVSNVIPLLTPLFVVVVPALDPSELGAVLGTLVPGNASRYSTDLSVLVEQPRTIDPARVIAGPVGMVPRELMEKIDFALAAHLNLVGVKIPRS